MLTKKEAEKLLKETLKKVYDAYEVAEDKIQTKLQKEVWKLEDDSQFELDEIQMKLDDAVNKAEEKYDRMINAIEKAKAAKKGKK